MYIWEKITIDEISQETIIEIKDEELASCKPGVNLIDKDLTNIDLLTLYFPKSLQYLCTFHVLKYFKTKVLNFLIKFK